MSETQVEVLQMISTRPGYLKKIDQIIQSGILDTKGGIGELHFDQDGNIRKINAPKVTTYP